MFFTFQGSNHEDAGHVHQIGHVCLGWRFSLDEVLKNGAGLLLKLLKLAPLESLWPFLLLRHLFIGEKEANFLFIFLSCASLIDLINFWWALKFNQFMMIVDFVCNICKYL